jgi:hypothetical protein
MRAPGVPLTKFSIRTMDEIQRHIIERGKRNAISRHYHAKDDKEAIATWRPDLSGILHTFKVCSVASVWRLLTSRFQTELRVDAHVTGSDTHQDAANKDTIVSGVHRDTSNAKVIVPDVRHDVTNTRIIVSDIHHNQLKSGKGADGRNQAVSTTHTLPVVE